MLNSAIYYFLVGFSLVVGGLCGIAIMAIAYTIIDSMGLKIRFTNNDSN